MVGINNLWTDCSKNLNLKAQTIISRLNRIVARRNQIVHEGDIKRLRIGGRISLNPIEFDSVRQDVRWMSDLVTAMDKIC